MKKAYFGSHFEIKKDTKVSIKNFGNIKAFFSCELRNHHLILFMWGYNVHKNPENAVCKKS